MSEGEPQHHEYGRRAADRRTGIERRRSEPLLGPQAPPWTEQRAQFLTRYLFWFLGLVYFNLSTTFSPWPTLATINATFAGYFLVNTAFMLHARQRLQCPTRWRLAMWNDIAFVSFCVIADHSSAIPPAFMAYLAVILGNGMRYSMRFFREAVVGSFILGITVLYFRYIDYLELVNLGTVFVILFGGIVVLYSYALMERVEQAKERLQHEGRMDALTGLLNRRALFEKAEVLFQGLDRVQRPLAVLFADLNKFKAVNDRLGHTTGDQVLQEISKLVALSVRRSDIVARYGGDEFVLILPDSDVEKAKVLAQRLQETLQLWVAENRIEISMSIGIGEAPRHGADLNSVLQSVDKAMYRGKLKSAHGGIQYVDEGDYPEASIPSENA